MVKCSWIQLLSKTKELLRLLAAKLLYILIVTINIEHLSKDVFLYNYGRSKIIVHNS